MSPKLGKKNVSTGRQKFEKSLTISRIRYLFLRGTYHQLEPVLEVRLHLRPLGAVS
jgi:hypothetical protein